MSSPEQPITPPLSAEYFESRYREAMQLDNQNDRYALAKSDPVFDDGFDDFRALTFQGLLGEQTATVADLAARDNSPYEILAREYTDVKDEQSEVKERLATITDQEDAQTRRLRLAAKRAIELAPSAEVSVTLLAEDRIAALKRMDREELRVRLGQLAATEAELDELYQVAGVEWPAPLVMREVKSNLMIIDEIPLIQETHATSEEIIYTKLLEKHGTTHGASLMLSAYMMDNLHTIFTPEQLGAALYLDPSHFEGMDEVAKAECMNQRIRSLLRKDSIVQSFLHDEGYQLQFGYRYFKDPATMKNVYRKRRIYRTVPLVEGVAQTDTFTDTIHVEPDDSNLVPLKYLIQDLKPSTLPTGIRAELTPPDASETMQLLDPSHVNSLMGLLWNKELLPLNPDSKLPVAALRTKLLQLPKELNGHSDTIQHLRNVVLTATHGSRFSSLQIVRIALDLSPKQDRRKTYGQITAELNDLVYRFYERLEPEATN